MPPGELLTYACAGLGLGTAFSTMVLLGTLSAAQQSCTDPTMAIASTTRHTTTP